jgi:hypothetical protein
MRGDRREERETFFFFFFFNNHKDCNSGTLSIGIHGNNLHV